MKNLLIAFVTFVVCLLVLEGGLRIKNLNMQNYHIEMWKYSNTLKFRSDDPVLGHEHRTNTTAVLQSIDIRTNSYGMRGAEPQNRDDVARRILFIGSSITLGWGVAEEDTMSVLLDNAFGPDVEVLNAGVGNYNAVRYIHAFLKSGKELQPTDIVIHYFVNDAEKLDRGRDSWILRNSQLAVMGWILVQRVNAMIGGGDLVSHYQEVYAEDAAGFQEAQATFVELFAYADENDIRLYFSMVPDVHNLQNYAFGFIHEKMKTVVEAQGMTFIDLLPAFDGVTVPQAVWAMPGDPHPNALGHQLMADYLFPLLDLKE